MQVPDLTTAQWLVTGFSALLVGLSKAGFGTGAGILAVPLMVTVLGPADMLPVMLLVLIAGDIFSVVHYRRVHHARNLAMLLPGLVLGILLGWLALDWFLELPDSRLWMKRLIGTVAVTFVCIQFHRMLRERQSGNASEPFRPAAWQGVSLGACAGVTSTLAHAGGPLLSLFMLPQQLPRQVFVGTLIKYFFIGNVIKLIPYWREGLMTSDNLSLALLLVPCVVLGTLIGVWMNRRFTDRAFRVVVYLLAFVFGLYLLSGIEIGGAAGGQDEARSPAPNAFELASRAYGAGDFAGAGRLFGVAAAKGLSPHAAAFNGALCAYREGRFGAADAGWAEFTGATGGLVRARAMLNRGNCAFRSGSFGRAAYLYAKTAAACGELDAGGDPNRGGLVREVERRARHNLGVAQGRLVAEDAGHRANGEARRPATRAGVDERFAEPGTGAVSLAGLKPTNSRVGIAGDGSAGDLPVERLLEQCVRRDTGPVVRGSSVRKSANSLRW